MLTLLVALIIVGILLWYIPLDPTIKRVIVVIVLILAVLWVFKLLTGGGPDLVPGDIR